MSPMSKNVNLTIKLPKINSSPNSPEIRLFSIKSALYPSKFIPIKNWIKASKIITRYIIRKNRPKDRECCEYQY